MRRLAFEALRELLVRIAERRRLVIFIDDLQWADLDGALLLEELLRPPDAPALLTVVSFRSEEVAGKPFLRKLLEGGDRGHVVAASPRADARNGSGRARRRAASSRFAAQRRPTDCGSPAKRAAVRSFWSSWPATPASTGRSRVGRRPLPRCSIRGSVRSHRSARRFLETLAICGRPMAPELVCAACGVARERQSLVAMLRSSHFIRSSGSSERVETYHDRIREVLAAQMAPDAVRRIHRLMVQTLVEWQSDDCEALFEHYRGAGDPENASIQAGRAADEGGRRACLRTSRILLPAGAGAGAGLIRRQRVERRTGQRARQCRPAGRGRRRLLRRGGRSRSPSAGRAPAARRPSSSSSAATSIVAWT